ncbi:MAG: VPLPA-CTERM sorting domain-containing protein [Pseudomonadota bacterium]
MRRLAVLSGLAGLVALGFGTGAYAVSVNVCGVIPGADQTTGVSSCALSTDLGGNPNAAIERASVTPIGSEVRTYTEVTADAGPVLANSQSFFSDIFEVTGLGPTDSVTVDFVYTLTGQVRGPVVDDLFDFNLWGNAVGSIAIAPVAQDESDAATVLDALQNGGTPTGTERATAGFTNTSFVKNADDFDGTFTNDDAPNGTFDLFAGLVPGGDARPFNGDYDTTGTTATVSTIDATLVGADPTEIDGGPFGTIFEGVWDVSAEMQVSYTFTQALSKVAVQHYLQTSILIGTIAPSPGLPFVLDFENTGDLDTVFATELPLGADGGFVSLAATDVGQVPLPASVWALLAALGALGLFGRRRA